MTEPTESDPSGIQEKRILVLEDTTAMRRMLVHTLEHVGAIVYEGANGEEGLSILRKASFKEESIDLILLDLMMPVMNGGQFLEEIRKNINLQNTRIIVISARSDSSTILGTAAYHVDAYIRKPYKVSDLLSRVESVLNAPTSLFEKANASPEHTPDDAKETGDDTPSPSEEANDDAQKS